MMYKPNTVSGVFEVKASAEFYDDEATVETLRYIIEQDLEDAGLDVDVKVLRKQMPLMTDREKMIHELTYQINSNEVMRQHYPVQLSVTDARKILKLLKEREPRTFHVIDKKTGKEADIYEIALHEDWANGLCYCDMEGWALEENGSLLLADECGVARYADRDRFEVVWDE